MNINQWVSLFPTEPRQYLKTPSSYKGMAVASNGHVVLFAPDNGYKPLEQKLEKGIDNVLKEIEKAKFKPFQLKDFSAEPTKCKTCKGTGKAEVTCCEECEGDGKVHLDSGYNEYNFTCASCDGEGVFGKPGGDSNCFMCNGFGSSFAHGASVEIDGQKFHPNYLRLFQKEKNIKYAISELPALLFKVGDYSGAIMGMNFNES